MRFSALFGEISRQTALSSTQLLKGNFSCASFSYRKDAINGAYGFLFLSGTRISNHLQMSQLSGSTFSSDILRLWVLVRSRAWTLDLRRSTTWTNQAAVFESLLTFSYAFYPHNRHWHTRYNWHLGCSHLPQTTQSSFDEIREQNVDGLCLKNSPFLIALIKVGSNWTATVASSRHSM